MIHFYNVRYVLKQNLLENFFPLSSHTTCALEFIHTDIADFKNTKTRGRKRYYISFNKIIHAFQEYICWEQKMRQNKKFLIYKIEVENQLDKKIKRH